MNLYNNIGDLWKNQEKHFVELYRGRLIGWRKDPVIIKIERPTRLDRARALGYKAKQGFVIARVRVLRGGRKREMINKGRKSKNFRQRKILGKNYQWIAEEKANRKFHNLEVLNSYFVGKDGIHYWYEIILVDPCNPVIKADPHINWVVNNRSRVFRGLTSAARKSRGLRGKGKGHEKIRPSLAAHRRK